MIELDLEWLSSLTLSSHLFFINYLFFSVMQKDLSDPFPFMLFVSSGDALRALFLAWTFTI